MIKLIQYLTGAGGIKLKEAADGTVTSEITILKTGKFTHLCYGNFKITLDHFSSFIKHFAAGTYGQDIPVNFNHSDSKGAAGWYKELKIVGKRLRAVIEWTDVGVEAIKAKRFKYYSAEYSEDYEDPATGKKHGPLLMGGALCIRPFMKGMGAVTLSENGGIGVADQTLIILHEEISKEITQMKSQILKKLSVVFLAVAGFTDAMWKQLSVTIDPLISAELTEDQVEATVKSLSESFMPTVKLLAETAQAAIVAPVVLPAPAAVTDPPKVLTAEEIAGLVAEGVAKVFTERDAAVKKLAEKVDSNRKLFADTINGKDGLSEETKTLLLSGSETITGDMTEPQVKIFAENQLKMADQMETAQKLHAMGMTSQGGRVQVIKPEEAKHIELAEERILTISGRKGMADARRFSNMGKATDDAKAFADKVIGQFDALYGRHISAEVKAFAAGDMDTADTNLPYAVVRTVIREALQDVVALNFVTADIASAASTTVLIPYITRDLSGMGSTVRVAEGGAIPYAGYTQDTELAYLYSKKLATKLSNELAFFTNNGAVDYDAMRDNFALVVRVVRERIDRVLFDEILLASDEYAAGSIAAEDIELQFNGVLKTFKTAQFPIVRERKVYDIKGNQVGNTANDIVVNYDGAEVQEWPGAGAAAGDYYLITDYNLGYFQIVDEAGVAIACPDATVCNISYDYVTNIIKFDTDLPADTLWKDHLDGLLNSFGRRKAMLSDDRYITPNFSLMSNTLNQTFTEAAKFEAGNKIEGAGLTNDGNLAQVKGVSVFGTNAPSLQMGDVRAVLGERGTTHYRVAKPFTMGEAFEAVDTATGKPVGKKQAYGEEYSCEHTPTPTKEKYTSVLVADLTNR